MDPSPSTVGCFGGMFKRRKHRRDKKPLPTSAEKTVTVNSVSEHSGATVGQHQCSYFSPACNFAYGNAKDAWREIEVPPSYTATELSSMSPEVLQTVETTLDGLNASLRELSLEIHSHPEIMFEERHTHDLLTAFMSTHGFKVTRHYLGLETAWRAEFTNGSGGRVLGINSEMDALRGIGHACGHNLIAISGVGVAIAVKKALETHNVPGKVVLLGTPAEEGGAGKAILLERGGYADMDACIMCHPGPGLPRSISVGTTIAMQEIEIEYYGHSAHAGAAPWEGTNALDAAFLAYSGISVLRQQMKPDHRIHGIVLGKDWSSNVIPDYAKMLWGVRAPNWNELQAFVKRAIACFEGAALATSCTLKIKADLPYFDLHQNHILADAFADIVGQRYGVLTTTTDSTASTDFGNISYALPSLHPVFAIPTQPNGGNHTPAFAAAAATEQAHAATIMVSKGLALTGFKILEDAIFFKEVRGAFDTWKEGSSE
ncbi:amidohydrolase [Pluteus cervinus]|uniref:Amidohydrolase n=1 Tax=Pluteus cervinus TaxID=181527 RepID=A0ACD3BAG7_9AGAR|nr:amidohydrolase [Pluteus cervinus]